MSLIDKIQPLNGQILIFHVDKSIESRNGLFIVNNENARNRTHEAIVMKTHPSAIVQPGQTVFYTVHSGGTEIRDEQGKTFRFMRESELLASL
jgi:co-chaperonin GroES (HSP10)